MMKTLDDWLAANHADLTAIRRDIHAHPELGLEEHRTAGVVAKQLRAWGIEVTEGVGGTGVVGVIKGRLPGQRAIGLRADMDCIGAQGRDRTALRLAI
jgi:metal-dependent amidase/aminoacylase/carboxypeptidase family protein